MARPRQLPWRRDPAILSRLVEVERLHLLRTPNTRIAAALGVAEATIRNDVARLRELWLERTTESVDALKARAIADLEDIKRRALAAAEFDETAERAVLYGEDADGNAVRVQRDERGSAQFRGQKAAALGVARQAVMDAAKVLGIVVERQDHTSQGEKIKAYINVDVDRV